MNRQRQIDFIEKAEERFKARWDKRLNDPKFIEGLRRYDVELETPPAQRFG